MQSLGERLHAARRLREEANARDEARRLRIEERKLEEQRRGVRNLIFGLNSKLVEAIEHGHEPVRKISKWEHQTWLREAAKGKAPHNQIIWDDWVSELEEEELRIVLEEDHDGMGMQSWINVRFEPHFFK